MHRVLLYCAECGQVRAFEAPPCADDHGDDCPERVCVECGIAVFVPTAPSDSELPSGDYDLIARRVA